MRQTSIVATSALLIALAAIWGVTVINAKSPAQASVPSSASSIDVMQMMKDAKDLPVQQFDAY